MNTIEKVRRSQPLIHHITNQVVMNFTANGLLSFGGSPIMAKAPSEARDISLLAKGVLINTGTILEPDLEAMIIAGQTANERGIPVVLDPVGVGASTFRKEVVESLLKNISFTAIKGNAGEMAYLAGVKWKIKGVESVDEDISKLEDITREVSRKYNTSAIATGETDVICSGNNIMKNRSGHEYLTKITGAGCLLGSILTACLTTDTEKIKAAYDAVHFYGSAAERAASRQEVNGTGTFLPHFIDELGKEMNERT